MAHLVYLLGPRRLVETRAHREPAHAPVPHAVHDDGKPVAVGAVARDRALHVVHARSQEAIDDLAHRAGPLRGRRHRPMERAARRGLPPPHLDALLAPRPCRAR